VPYGRNFRDSGGRVLVKEPT